MKVKELITQLLDEPMDRDVMISLEEPNENSSGYFFGIEGIERKYGVVGLLFHDWRKEQKETKDDEKL